MNDFITTSVFELFKIGPGPSSSHTIGPMKAALRFRRCAAALPGDLQARAHTLLVTLYGSLSATGRGHGTDKAILAGLLGAMPETVDPQWLRSLLREPGETYTLDFESFQVEFTARHLLWGLVNHNFAYSNTIDFELLDVEGRILLDQRYYSVGGGFIRWDGWQPESQRLPAYPYTKMKELLGYLEQSGLSLPEFILRNEMAISRAARTAVLEGIDRILEAMDAEVSRGLSTEGVLPGAVGLRRKAPVVLQRASSASFLDQRMIRLNAYCLAASEENAAGNRVVTAPTSGACGVIPGLIYWLRHDGKQPVEKLREGLLAAAAVGFLVKHNASISGAEVGCQGEVGAASAMGAALLAQVFGLAPERLAAAAEIALEHHLGMTCDPVGGYVQIPCIERNAMGAAKAYNSFLLASACDPSAQKVSFDVVVETMWRTGRDMSTRYKETSEGGLALSLTHC